MKAEFYLADERHVTVKLDALQDAGKEVVNSGVLYFKFERAQHGSTVPFILDGRATREQVKEFPAAFQAFKKLHPSFELPWSDLNVGEVVAKPVEVKRLDPEVKPEAPAVTPEAPKAPKEA